MVSELQTYRKSVPIYQDVWDWDIILLHGDVKIICRAMPCLWEFHHQDCDCAETPRLSSPVLDRFGKRISEGAPYQADELTGEARSLLDAGPGSEIPVMSGKTYRLNGPRKQHDGFATGSIWTVYAEQTPEQKPKGFFSRLLAALLSDAKGTSDAS